MSSPTDLPTGASLLPEPDMFVDEALTYLSVFADGPLTPDEEQDVVANASLILRRLAVIEYA